MTIVRQQILQILPVLLKRPTNNASTAVRMLHGVSWQVMVMPITRALTFSIAVLQARFLGKTGYGELGMALSTLTLFNLFATGAAGNTCTKFIAEFRLSDPERAQRICGVSLQATSLLAVAASVVCYVLAPHLSTGLLHNPSLTGLLRLCAIALIIQTLEGTLTGILYGFQSFRSASVATTIQVATWLPFTWFFTPRLGPFGALLAFTLSHLVCVVGLGLATFRELKAAQFHIRWNDAWKEASVLWEYSLPMILHGLVCVPTLWATNALLARQPGGYSQLGAYNAAFQFRTAVIQVPMMLQGIAMPFLSEMSGARNAQRFARLFDHLMRISGVVGLMAATGVSIFGRPLMQLFGHEFRTDSAMLAVVMAVATTSLLSSLAGAALQASGVVWSALWANLFYATASILLAWLLVPHLLGMGLAISFVISTCLQAFLLLHLLSRQIHAVRVWPHAIVGILSTSLICALAFPAIYLKVVCVAAVMAALCMARIPNMICKLRDHSALASV